ncbi:MAG: electron transport complex subunit RsxC [Paludibacteraceae bacterium]|nr:electron transport complex subunit RsxC [Paludibacteraceae bacterium]
MKTFKIGGIHPHDNKLSAGRRFEQVPVPKEVIIQLNQHIGAPAIPIVEPGEEVKVGQLIAKANGFVSANIHSSVSGKVSKIDTITDAWGTRQQAIFIDVEGDVWMPDIDTSCKFKPTCNLSAEVIKQKIADAGIVGLGGACFPTHVKLNPPKEHAIDTLIINGAECEPYLTPNHRLMIEKGEEIMVGVQILMRALGVDRALIGIESNKQDAIDELDRIAARKEGIEVIKLKKKYPQGGEKQLIQALTDREVESGQLPSSVGVVVQNIATVFAVYEAVQLNKPLIEMYMSISGKEMEQNGNFCARIGTSVKDVVAMIGGMPENTGKIIAGGPMMGKAMIHIDTPVTKRTTGITFISAKSAPRFKASACIRCARCIQACPMGLEPYLLYKKALRQDWDFMEAHHIMDCMECGCCTFTCPSRQPLLDYIRVGKATVANNIRARKSNEK